MADPAEKGKFSTEIGQDVIAEALKSVQRSAAPEISVEVESDVDAGAEPVAESSAPAEPPEVAELRAQLEFSQAKGRELMDKIRETHERMLRAVADLENFKKRALKEKEEVQRFGIEKLLKDFLPVSDNLDRALEHAKSSSDFDGLRQGVQMTRKLFEDTLGKHGVRPFSAVGKPFDPRMHEAMQQVETAQMPPNHVAGEILRGYMLNDRLVRPALVMVSKAVETAAPSAVEPSPAAPAATAIDAAGEAPQTGPSGEKV